MSKRDDLLAEAAELTARLVPKFARMAEELERQEAELNRRALDLLINPRIVRVVDEAEPH